MDISVDKHSKVKAFLKGDFTYYTGLYIKFLDAYRQDQRDFRSVYLNALMDLDAPFWLALSACVPNDPAPAVVQARWPHLGLMDNSGSDSTKGGVLATCPRVRILAAT